MTSFGVQATLETSILAEAVPVLAFFPQTLRPELLWLLLLALLPIIIHLLNRLRYKTVKWAAMMFLLKANQSSTRNARLRHWLILASRCLLLFFFLYAICRPIVSGWLGSALAGAPEKVLLCLDRSASMELVDPRLQVSKREQALDLFAQAAEELGTGSRYVLIESVLREPQELASAGALKDLERTAATDTAADIPSLLRAALEYLRRNPGGRSEIWLASDLQKSNWRPESEREWQGLAAQLDSLQQNVRIRLIPLTTEPVKNVGVELLQFAANAEKRKVDFSLRLRSSQVKTPEFPMTMVVNERQRSARIDLDKADVRLQESMPVVGEMDQDLWGFVDLPADENPADNRMYFVSGPSPLRKAITVGARTSVKRVGVLAVVPNGMTRIASAMDPGAANDLALNDAGLVIWQGKEMNNQMASNLVRFVESGGQLLMLPSAEPGQGEFAGLSWQEIENAVDEDGFKVERWDEDEGPLARTSDGTNLKVNELNIQKRQNVDIDDAWQKLADFEDNEPLLLRKVIGQGRVYALTTLPEPEWSRLADGLVLVPMVQRLLTVGSDRLARVRTAVCGEWKPLSEESIWQPLHTTDASDFRWKAGVYQSDNNEKIALNRPLREDDPNVIETEGATRLFGDLPVTAVAESEQAPGKKVTSELWKLFVYLAAFFMLIEGFLLLLDRKPNPRLRGATVS